MTNLATTVGTLHAFGAQHVLVMNLPDLGLTPYAIASGQSAQLTALSFGFNATLEGAIAGLGFDVAMVDIFGSFQQIVADPAAFGLSNVTTSCFNGATVLGKRYGRQSWYPWRGDQLPEQPIVRKHRGTKATSRNPGRGRAEQNRAFVDLLDLVSGSPPAKSSTTYNR